MNSDGTGVKQISDFTNDYNVVGSPTWSPDGKKLAMGSRITPSQRPIPTSIS
jgi:Tol biopolymer transport system component